MSGGLIDPAQFPFRSAEMDVSALGCAATTLRRLGSGVSGAADGLVDSWSGLRPLYQGPQQEQVWGLMRPVAVSAERIEGDLSTAADRLDDLASSLGVLRAQLADLEERAARFRAEVVDGVWAPITESADFVVALSPSWGVIPWNQDTDTVAKNEDLLLEHAKLVERITTASAECHNALMDLVRWATEEHDVVGVDAAMLMDRRVEYPWGAPVAEDRHWGESVGHGGYMFGFNLAAGATGLLLGYDLRMEEYSPGYRDEMLTGLGDVWVSSSATGLWSALAVANPGLARLIDERLSDDQRQWLHDRRLATASVAGDLVGVDVRAHVDGQDGLWRWREDGVATGTESVLNIASMLAPSGGAAAGALRTGSVGARLLRVVTGAGDFLVPGTSALTYGSIRVTSGLAAALRRVDDIPVLEPSGAGVAGNAVDAADSHTMVTETPLSDELFGDGPDGTELPEAIPPVDSWELVDIAALTDGPVPTPREVLMPEGTPIGDAGTRPGIRVIHGDYDAAVELFGKLNHDGRTVHLSETYRRVALPNGSEHIGFRTRMTKSGTDTIVTVDTKFQDIPIDKVKFVYDYT